MRLRSVVGFARPSSGVADIPVCAACLFSHPVGVSTSTELNLLKDNDACCLLATPCWLLMASLVGWWLAKLQPPRHGAHDYTARRI